MLHDLEESRRMNALLSHELQKSADADAGIQFPIDYLVVSDNYWPTLTDKAGNAVDVEAADDSSALKHHPQLDGRIKQFGQVFENLKKPRKLLPLSGLGQADLELGFEDGSVRSFSVTPAQASLVMHVADADGPIDSMQLAALVQMEEEDVRRKMGYWVSKSVVCVRYDTTSGITTVENNGVLIPSCLAKIPLTNCRS